MQSIAIVVLCVVAVVSAGGDNGYGHASHVQHAHVVKTTVAVAPAVAVAPVVVKTPIVHTAYRDARGIYLATPHIRHIDIHPVHPRFIRPHASFIHTPVVAHAVPAAVVLH